MQISELIKLSKFTVLLGKNGAGKSTLLRNLDNQADINTNYISPERGGTLKYDPGVDNNISSNDGWLKSVRNRNRSENFRQQSAAQFRILEVLVLREIERDIEKRNDHNHTFDNTINKLNDLLPAIQLIRGDRGFIVQSKSGVTISEENISSGESELIALAIEVLVFNSSTKSGKVLLLDEPDVHLHPDLQHKFIEFIESVAIESDLRIVIATHSTSIIGAFSHSADLQIIPISARDQTEFNSFRQSQVTGEILPIFGVHPLSTIFNKSPVVLVEGEDDKRVLEQVVRSSNGKYIFSPCAVGSVAELAGWEAWLNQFLPAIYDNPIAYSLRDLDDSQQTELNNIGFVTRVRLNCYAMENLLLTNECLNAHNLTTESFLEKLNTWLKVDPNHIFAAEIQNLVTNFETRRVFKIKNLRNIIVAILGSNKPWEVIVGRCISSRTSVADNDQNSIHTYLGTKAIETIFLDSNGAR